MSTENWDPKDIDLYLRVETQMRDEDEEWYIVDLMIGDKVAGHGEAANIGVLAKEGQCEATATVYALFDFSRNYQRNLKRVYIKPREDSGTAVGPDQAGDGSGSDPEPVSVDWQSVLGRARW